jgi:hypothetical protein
MHIPELAPGAIAGELQLCGNVAFGDVAGAVDTGEKHRHALLVGPRTILIRVQGASGKGHHVK